MLCLNLVEMAVLRNAVSGDFVLLNSRHVIGRSARTSNTVLLEKDVSKSHATIFWEDGIWKLNDHSRNGTVIGHKHIHQDSHKLKKGAKIKFGRQETAVWTFEDDSPPSSYLQSVREEQKVLALTPVPGLPNPDDPEISFYYTRDNRWKAEKAGTEIDLEDGTMLNFSEDDWVFVENDVLDETIDYGQVVTNALFRFILSADEEKVAINIQTVSHQLDLGVRVYHYILLALVRKRLQDQADGYVLADQGWMEVEDLVQDLNKELGRKRDNEIDEYYLNVQIYRLRKQLVGIQPIGYLFSSIIDRRKGEMRFSYPFFQIIKEDQIIGEVMPADSETIKKEQNT